MPDLVFGKYEILRRLAVGGMGEVFLARQTGIGGFDRRVILKSLLPDLADDEDFVNQFLDEARVAATLNHPNIVAIYEVGKWSGTYFIAMEYIPGANLAQVVKRIKKDEREIPLPVTARIIHDACSALDHAHHARDYEGNSLAIVHRDISPQNIMVRHDGVTKVVDFGIAKAANKMTRTATGILKGKFPYMSPEQVETLVLDGRSDQFSMGIIFWEICTQQRLFKSTTQIETLKQVLQKPIPRPETILPGFPPELSEIIMRMLARDREQRYPRLSDTATELSAYLETCSQGGLVGAVAELLQGVVPEDDPKNMMTPSSTGNFVIPLNPVPEGSAPVGAPGQPAAGAGGEMDIEIVTGTALTPPLSLGAVSELLPPPAVAPPEAHPPHRRTGLVVGLVTIVGLLAAGGYLATRQAPPAASVETGAADPTVPATPVETVATAEAPSAPVLGLSSQPPGARVTIDGKRRGITPLTLDDLAPGSHQLVFSLAGHDVLEQPIELAAGQRRDLGVALVKKRKTRKGRRPRATSGKRPVSTTVAPPLPVRLEDGYLTLNTKPWTKVNLDGSPLGTTPLFKRKLEPGPHRLHLVNEEAGIDITRKVTIRAGKNEKVFYDLRK